MNSIAYKNITKLQKLHTHTMLPTVPHGNPGCILRLFPLHVELQELDLGQARVPSYVSTSFLSSAHHQVPPCHQGRQEGPCAGAQEYGEVPAVPDPGWNPLPPCQLGAPQRPGQFLTSNSRLRLLASLLAWWQRRLACMPLADRFWPGGRRGWPRAIGQPPLAWWQKRLAPTSSGL